ncbi:unnamed protein product [marine sediment metagenome]|uniref:Uncharacterized protein n=1 Tax=marine sediment metagenome TaxID=412755 RepID=X1DQT7_9ZZZZ
MLEDKLVFVWEAICLKRDLDDALNIEGVENYPPITPSQEQMIIEVFEDSHENVKDLLKFRGNNSIYVKEVYDIWQDIYDKRFSLIKEFVKKDKKKYKPK